MNLFTLSLAIFSLSNIPSTSQQTVHQQSACNELRTILNSETSEQCHPITQIKGLDCWQPLITKISSETEMPLAFKLMELEDACEEEHKQLRKEQDFLGHLAITLLQISQKHMNCEHTKQAAQIAACAKNKKDIKIIQNILNKNQS